MSSDVVHHELPETRMKIEGEPQAKEQAIHNLVDGVDPDIEPCESNRESEDYSYEEADALDHAPECPLLLSLA